MVNVIIFLGNVLVRLDSPVHCALIVVQRVHTVKTVNQSANAKMKARAIHKLVNANAHPVGLVMFVRIDVQLVSMVGK